MPGSTPSTSASTRPAKRRSRRTRVGLKYDKVIANVERLLALRDAAGTSRPKLILSFVRQNDSDDEHAFIEHWRKRADKIHITDLHNWAGTLNQKSDVNYPVLPAVADVHRTLGRAGLAVLRGLRRPAPSSATCGRPPSSEIWNSDRYRAVRREHLESGGPDICRSCDLPKKDSPLWITKLR